MSTSLVMFMIIDQMAKYRNLNSASSFYAGLPTSPCQGENIIGGYQNYGRGASHERTISLPEHIKIKITAQILLEDSWDNEVLSIYIDGAQVRTFSKAPYDGTYFCGNGDYPEIWFDFNWESDHTDSAITIKLSSTLDEEAWNESWAFKNFKVYYMTECFYLYTECNYSGTEYKFCPKIPLENQQEFVQPIKSMKVPLGRILYLQAPNFYGGVMQKYEDNQVCIDPFSFPKQIVIP